MNAKQKKQVLKILANDCQIANHYITSQGTCAIGALALKAGVPKRFLRRFNNKGIGSLAAVLDKIWSKFGLTSYELRKIQDENDFHDFVQERRKAVVKLVKQMAVTL